MEIEKSLRRSGKTIRIVDQLVQDYFNYGRFTAKDHPPRDGVFISLRNRDVYLKVIDRLYHEHNIDLRKIKPQVDHEGSYFYSKQLQK